MMPVIRISDATWDRLKGWAVPLEDTPDDALKKILDAADEHLKCSRLASKSTEESSPSKTKSTEKPRRGKKVPQLAFNDPILESLHELGGKGRATEVLKLVERKMKHLLGEFDYEALPSGDTRWEKTANWARYWLAKRGFLRSDSERGVWILTEEGRRIAESKKT